MSTNSKTAAITGIPPTSAQQLPVRVAIGILTFRRPDGIRKMLSSLMQLERHPKRPYELAVIVVDNDAEGSSRGTIAPYLDVEAFTLTYVVEPRQGIPFARNRAMDEAPEDTDLFCFVDDDEWTIPGWLDAFLATRARTGAQCLHGPVVPVYPEQRPEYFVKSRVFEFKRHAEGASINFAASNNVMFDLRLFRSLGLRFEERMRFTGGTDFVLFNHAHRRGVSMAWSDGAIVYDVIPLKRMNWKWILQRQYRLGNTFAMNDRLFGNAASCWYRATYGTARFGLGLAMLPALAVSPRWGMRALTHVFRGAGMVAGLIGHAYDEYSPTRISGSSARGGNTG